MQPVLTGRKTTPLRQSVLLCLSAMMYIEIGIVRTELLKPVLNLVFLLLLALGTLENTTYQVYVCHDDIINMAFSQQCELKA